MVYVIMTDNVPLPRTTNVDAITVSHYFHCMVNFIVFDKVFAGKLFRLGEHLQRLNNSLESIRIANPMDNGQWQDMLEQLVAVNGQGDQSLYIQVTRGCAPERNHSFPANPVPTVFAMTSPLLPVDTKELAKGYSAITLDDIRWQWCNIKAITLLPNVLLKQQAIDNNHCEAILIRDGLAIEGAASNLFVISENSIITPPKSSALLPGITRDLVLELAQINNFSWQEKQVPLSLMQSADEIWMTSSTKEIIPIVELDGKPVSDGKAGPVWTRMIKVYQDYKAALSTPA